MSGANIKNFVLIYKVGRSLFETLFCRRALGDCVRRAKKKISAPSNPFVICYIIGYKGNMHT